MYYGGAGIQEDKKHLECLLIIEIKNSLNSQNNHDETYETLEKSNHEPTYVLIVA